MSLPTVDDVDRWFRQLHDGQELAAWQRVVVEKVLEARESGEHLVMRVPRRGRTSVQDALYMAVAEVGVRQ